MAYQSQKPFLLLMTIPRTGSNWLAEVLQTNGLAAPLEFMKPWRENPPSDPFDRTMAAKLALMNMEQSGCQMLSTKMFPDEYDLLGHDATRWSRFVSAPKLYSIVLWRRDLRAQAYSYYVAKRSGRWYNHGVVTPEEIDSKALLAAFEFVLNDIQRLQRMVNELGPHLTLVYEDLLTDMPKAIKQIYHYVGVTPPTNIKLTTQVQLNQYSEDRELVWQKILTAEWLEREASARALCEKF